MARNENSFLIHCFYVYLRFSVRNWAHISKATKCFLISTPHTYSSCCKGQNSSKRFCLCELTFGLTQIIKQLLLKVQSFLCNSSLCVGVCGWKGKCCSHFTFTEYFYILYSFLFQICLLIQ